MNFKKLISLLLILAATVCILSACEPEDSEQIPEASTSAAETEPAAPATLVLIDNGNTDFKIIRSENAKGYDLDTATAVYQRAKETLSSAFKLSEDWINPLEPSPEDAHEILLFDTNRTESQAALSDLDFDGYLIRITDCKVVVVGSSPTACNEALYQLFDYIIPDYTKDGVTALPVGLEVKAEVSSEDVDIGEALRAGKTVCADFEIVFKYAGPTGFKTAQGAATDGKYAYIAMKNSDDSREVDKIIKIDMETWSVVAESEVLPLDHANDMTYDPEKNQLIVTNMYNCLISLIDPETLTVIEQPTLPYGSWGIGYIDGASRYTFLSSGVTVTDNQFNPLYSIPFGDTTGYTGQGMDADSRYAYVPLSPNGKKDNIIQIYDLETAEYLGNVTVDTKMESESMFHTGGKQYIQFNASGSQIAVLEYYVRFE